LLDLDDLTASTASIMTLLAALVSHPDVRVDTLDVGASVTSLVPRLWPFLSHNVSTVRKSALNTLHSLMARRDRTGANAVSGPT
jgi:TATA-binding protein-associated factor